MKRFITIVITLFILNNVSFTQCVNLVPIALPFVESFENYSDTLRNNDTLFCSGSYSWTFNASNPNGRAMCGSGSPINNGGIGGVTFDVDAANVFNINELILTLDLTNYNLTDPIYLSFDCNNIADEPHIEDRIFIRGSENSPWIEVFNWSTLPPNQWHSLRENIQISNTLINNSQNLSSTFQVKFSQKDNYGYPSDGFAIDNIAIEIVNCPKAQNFILDYQNEDSVILSWGNSTNQNWNIQYGLKGFLLGEGNTIQTSNSQDTITQLDNNSIYEFYIQSNCGNNELSSWEGPLTVYTKINNDSSCNSIFIEPNGNLNKTHNINTGLQFSEAFVLNNSPKNTIWFKTVVPNSGHLAIETCSSLISTEIGAYSNPSNCSDLTTYNELAIASFSSASTQNVCQSPGKAAVELCNLNPGDTVLFWIGSYITSVEGEINFSVYDYSVLEQAGTPINRDIELCSTDSLNLFSNIQGYSKSNNWKWEYAPNPNSVQNDSILINALTTFSSSPVYYIVSNICNADTTSFNISVSESNYAGSPISGLEYCNTSPIFLFNGLTGLVETGGVWYNSNQEPLNNSTFNPKEDNFGSYQFSYIVDKNICKADTSHINIEVLNCTNITESQVQGSLIYPNPTTGIINFKSNELSKILIYNISGKLIKKLNYESLNLPITINLTNLAKGSYLFSVFNKKSTEYRKIIIQ